MQDVLYQNLIRLKGGSSEETPGICDRILGAHDIDEVILVDQSPLAQISKIDTSGLRRSIRSNQGAFLDPPGIKGRRIDSLCILVQLRHRSL